jgi:hypothetical protein
MRAPLISGDEQDAVGRSHLAHSWRPGERKEIKRRINRRERRQGRLAARNGGE